MRLIALLGFLFIPCLLTKAVAQHSVLTQGDGRLVLFNSDGSTEWEMAWGGIHDIHRLPNGNVMVQENMNSVVEIDVKTKKIVWKYDSSQQNGNQGNRIEVHSFQPVENGRLMIAESGARRIIEVDRNGTIFKQIDLVVDHPDAHTDNRLVRKIANGNYLVCHEADGAVREYDSCIGSA